MPYIVTAIKRESQDERIQAGNITGRSAYFSCTEFVVWHIYEAERLCIYLKNIGYELATYNFG